MSRTVTGARHTGIARRPARGAGDAGRDDGPPLRIRVVGAPEDVADAVAALRLVLPVTHVSQPAPARDVPGQVRVYVHSDVPPPPGECGG